MKVMADAILNNTLHVSNIMKCLNIGKQHCTWQKCR